MNRHMRATIAFTLMLLSTTLHAMELQSKIHYQTPSLESTTLSRIQPQHHEWDSTWQYTRLILLGTLIGFTLLVSSDICHGTITRHSLEKLCVLGVCLACCYTCHVLEKQLLHTITYNKTLESKILLTSRFIPRLTDCAQQTAVTHAALHGASDTISMLHAQGHYQPEAALWQSHPSPLWCSLAHEQLEAAQTLLSIAPKLFDQQFNNKKLLESMVILNKPRAVEWLLAHGADIEARYPKKASLLAHLSAQQDLAPEAFFHKYPCITGYLKAYEPSITINSHNCVGNTPLINAISSSETFELPILLLDNGANCRIPHKQTQKTPLQIAQEQNKRIVAQTLEALGGGATPLDPTKIPEEVHYFLKTHTQEPLQPVPYRAPLERKPSKLAEWIKSAPALHLSARNKLKENQCRMQ